jgi:hypothetical protein
MYSGQEREMAIAAYAGISLFSQKSNKADSENFAVGLEGRECDCDQIAGLKKKERNLLLEDLQHCFLSSRSFS